MDRESKIYGPTKTNQLPPLPSATFRRLNQGGEVSPVCKKIGILFNIGKGVGQNVLLTWGGGVSRGEGEVGSFLSLGVLS